MTQHHDELPNWLPDWLPTLSEGRSNPANPASRDDTISLQNLPPAGSEPQDPPPSEAASGRISNGDGYTRTIKQVFITPSPGRTVSRKLRGVQMFMITLNATLGTGLYWRGGQMLELGGSLAAFLSFILVGALAWAVMQCIAEMLCIWPVPGALSVYVREFVDEELGIAVGIAYWYTYSVAFAALIVTTASEVTYWIGQNDAIKGTIMYLLLPFLLVLINAFEVEIFGWIEVFSGTIKIIFLAIIMIFLLVIRGIDKSRPSAWDEPMDFDTTTASNWGTAFFMSISIATFAYVGVEIVAASALEAKWSNSQRSTPAGVEKNFISKTVKFTAIFFPFLAAAAYTLSSLIASFNIERDHASLSETGPKTASPYVIIAYYQTVIPHLGDVFNAFLIFTALTCANTNLFVASRSLFGLTARLEGGHGQPWYIRFSAYFGKTNRHKVPMRAVIFSALFFCWVPFIELVGNSEDMDKANNKFIEVLAQMGSVGVIVVWACNCLAFIRYYYCIEQHKTILKEQKVPQVRRWDTQNDDYPYRSHWQPYLAWVALFGCLFILVVIDGSLIWHGFQTEPFLSAYLFIIVFIFLWVCLKVVRHASWSLVDLSNPTRVIQKINYLHDKRFEANMDPTSNAAGNSTEA